MTIDERIERLVERHEVLTDRHEALAQTVELLTHQGIQQGERIDKILLAISQDADNIRALANIAQAHQASIDGLERRTG